MKIALIRHGETKGNLEKRYIGVTDDEITPSFARKLKEAKAAFRYPETEKVFVSPMRRCIQTAEIIYPGIPICIEEDLKECDFGQFENKNYQELTENKAYQRWIDSGGNSPFPGGESVDGFRMRTVNQFFTIIRACEGGNNAAGNIAIVAHGGTIMAVMSYFIGESNYYDWQVSNGEGYFFECQNTLHHPDFHVCCSAQSGANYQITGVEKINV